jgi:hypothetical protein
MNPTIISWLVAASLLLLFFLWYLRAFFTRISGVWIEEVPAGEPASTMAPVRLRQFGPWVWGRAELQGGFQQYSGWFNGKTLELKRKDFGAAYFERIGFPKSVIPKLDGTEMSRMEFEFDRQAGRLEGKQFRQKVEIDRQRRNPVITSRLYLPGVPKVWKRTAR